MGLVSSRDLVNVSVSATVLVNKIRKFQLSHRSAAGMAVLLPRSASRGDGAGLLSSGARDVRGELAHVGMRVRAGVHALHADRAVEHARLAALASVCALLPPQPSSGRCTMATPPLKTACGTEPRQRRAPHPRGMSSRLAASPCRVERPERRGRQQRGGQRAPAPREGKFGKNNCHNIGKAKRSRSDLRGCGAESLLGIDESTQEKGLRAKGPIWYGD